MEYMNAEENELHLSTYTSLKPGVKQVYRTLVSYSVDVQRKVWGGTVFTVLWDNLLDLHFTCRTGSSSSSSSIIN